MAALGYAEALDGMIHSICRILKTPLRDKGFAGLPVLRAPAQAPKKLMLDPQPWRQLFTFHL
jgi:hypothetical protein